MVDLENQVALVTGSDSGIGRAIALELARIGASVAVTFRTDAAGARHTQQQIRELGRKSITMALDVRDETDVANAFSQTRQQLGNPFILINASGIGARGDPVARTPTEVFDNVVRTDLYGAFFCCREFIRGRQSLTGGKIVNITSVHEAIPSPGNAAYGAAKGGLLAFTRSLALELVESRINVNAIAPGLIRTPMTEARIADPARREEQIPRIPWGRPGRAEEVARLAAYLVSPDADYMTGQSLTLDGGLEMNWGQGV